MLFFQNNQCRYRNSVINFILLIKIRVYNSKSIVRNLFIIIKNFCKFISKNINIITILDYKII